MKRIVYIVVIAILVLLAIHPMLSKHTRESKEIEVDPKETIFEHLGDAYSWEVPYCNGYELPLPIIVKSKDGSLHFFSSSRILPEHESNAEKIYEGFKIAHFAVDAGGNCLKDEEGNPQFSQYKGKVVEILPDGTEYRPLDFSITKNVLALIITVFIVAWICLSLARFHKKQGMKGPRGFKGAVEALIEFVYGGVIKPTLGDKTPKFAPYLMTVFMFIFMANLLGLIVIFPGGANLTGNIAITLVLAIFTFLMTNLFGTKHYWKDIFWPDVPIWLKFPLPIMPVIEVFGVFTKPAALTVRLFANMMGGHMIVIVLTLLIFIFAAMNIWIGAVTSVVSVLFSVFMLLIDVLVSFIQAFVFTMLSTIFISLAQEGGHKEE